MGDSGRSSPLPKSADAPAAEAIPVVLLVAQQPEQVAALIKSIRDWAPPYLLVAADGPSIGNMREAALCQQVHQVIRHEIDWPCRVETQVSKLRLGPRAFTCWALDWVFRKVPAAIILEEGFLPDPGFYAFCRQWLPTLDQQEHMPLGVLQNASSIESPDCGVASPGTVLFSHFFSGGSWATWRSVWKAYDRHLQRWPAWRRSQQGLSHWIPDEKDQAYWKERLDRIANREVDSWMEIMNFSLWREQKFSLIVAPQTILELSAFLRANSPFPTQTAPSAGFRLPEKSGIGHQLALSRKRAAIAESYPLRVVIGAGDVPVPAGWVATEQDELNLLMDADWAALFTPSSIETLFAEHVWEHLTPEQGSRAAVQCLRYLRPGGRLRIAVPDGYHPDPNYIRRVKVGGAGPGADDHKVLYQHHTLAALFEEAGFTVQLLEFFDAQGKFHAVDWEPDHGWVSRSSRNDRRNRTQPLRYTSLILDAIKPSEKME